MRDLLADAGHSCPEETTVSWSDLKAAYARSDYAERRVSLRSVCHGSSIAFGNETSPHSSSSPHVAIQSSDSTTSTKAAPTKSPDLIRHLQDLQNRLDQKLYDRMVRDVTSAERRAEAAKDVSLSSYKEQMRFGAHVISMMAVFFLFGYFACVRVVPSEALRVLCGVVCMFAAMVMETVLFIFKDARDAQSANTAPRGAIGVTTKTGGTATHTSVQDQPAAGKLKIT